MSNYDLFLPYEGWYSLELFPWWWSSEEVSQKLDKKYTPPFHVGKKQKRAVIDFHGKEVIVFRKGDEDMAQEYCDFLNRRCESSDCRR